MAGGFLYLDSSALVKLVLPEAESEALLELVTQYPDRVSSALAATEVIRAVHRASDLEMAHRRAIQVVEGIHLLTLDESVLFSAAKLPPAKLRTLDATSSVST